jgi:hypothetical protein
MSFTCIHNKGDFKVSDIMKGSPVGIMCLVAMKEEFDSQYNCIVYSINFFVYFMKKFGIFPDQRKESVLI